MTALVALVSSACADPAGPASAKLLLELPAEGIFVLLGTPYHPSGHHVEGRAHAETLHVTSPTTYRLTGVYDERRNPEVYRERHDLTVVPHADGQHMVFQSLAAGGNRRVRVHDDSLVVVTHPGHPYPLPATYRRSAAPPPPGPLASLQLAARDTVVLHGGSLDLRGLVVRGIDSTGRWVRNPPLTVEAPEGWDVAPGPVLTAPREDGTVPIRLRSGPVEEEVRIAAVPDLRTGRWRLTWSCHEPKLITGDSAMFVVEIESARYAPPIDPYEGYPFLTGPLTMRQIPWAQAALYTTGTKTSWRDDEATASAVSHLVAVRVQRPDSILIVPPGRYPDDFPAMPVAFHRVAGGAAGAPRVYVAPPDSVGFSGGHTAMCPQVGGEARFEELPVADPGTDQ